MNWKNLGVALFFIIFVYFGMYVSFIVGGQYLCEKSGGIYAVNYCVIKECLKDVTLCNSTANRFYMVPKSDDYTFKYPINITGDESENPKT